MIKIIPIGSLIIFLILTYAFRNYLNLNFPKIIAVFIIIFSLIIITLGLLTLILNKTTIIPGDKPNRLVKNGIFRFVRNPIYLGDTFLIIGFSLYFKTFIGLIFALLFFLIIHKIVIPVEEHVLETAFKDEYKEYKQKVKRWGIF